MKRCKVLQVFGFRAQESPARSKRDEVSLNKRLTTQTRQVYDYLPIHRWSMRRVWKSIKSFYTPYHWAYDLGMPRLSCVFCVFATFDALVMAGLKNPKLLTQYVEVERKIGHSFQKGLPISSVKEAIEQGYRPNLVGNRPI